MLDGVAESAEGGEMKTPEQLAEEFVQAWWGPRKDNLTLATRQSFLAGYQAGYDEAKKYWATTPKYELLDEEEK
jgi:hypothetical protein